MTRECRIIWTTAVAAVTWAVGCSPVPPTAGAQDELCSLAPVPVSSPSLAEAVPEYVAQHGVIALLEAYYQLIGTRPSAKITAQNATLAAALGLRCPQNAKTCKLDKAAIRAALPRSRKVADRRLLARFLADPAHTPALTRTQRLFLEWHFSSPRSYSAVLHKPGRTAVVGWNAAAEFEGPDDFTLLTFGQLGCTTVFAVAPDGAVQLSHYDGVVNPTQIYVLAEFDARHGVERVYVSGVRARQVASAVKERLPEATVALHVKSEFKGQMYSARCERRNGVIRQTHAVRAVSADYLQSVVNGAYGEWFALGRASQIFPPDDAAFTDTVYKPWPSR